MKFGRILSLILAFSLACAPVAPAKAEPLSTIVIGMLGYALATAKAAAFKLKIDYIIKKFNDVIVPRVGAGFVKGGLAGSTPTAAYAYHQHLQVETVQKTVDTLQNQHMQLAGSAATLTTQNNDLEKTITALKAAPFTSHVNAFIRENPAITVLAGVAGISVIGLALRQIFKPTIILQNNANQQQQQQQNT